MVEPVSDSFLESQVHSPVALLVDADGEVTSLVQQRDSINVGQLQLETIVSQSLWFHCLELGDVYVYLKQKFSHFRQFGAVLLEAVEIVRGEDEESLLPPGEESVPLVPDDPLPDHLLAVRLALVITLLLLQTIPSLIFRWEMSR